MRIGGHDVTITRPDKVLFPQDRITKQELIEYYRRIAPWILPHLRGRDQGGKALALQPGNPVGRCNRRFRLRTHPVPAGGLRPRDASVGAVVRSR